MHCNGIMSARSTQGCALQPGPSSDCRFAAKGPQFLKKSALSEQKVKRRSNRDKIQLMAKHNHVSKNKTQEGGLARPIEEVTAQLPSDTFLWAALGSMAVSLALKIAGRPHNALFVGQWAAPFLLLGVYNKIVKVSGHDQEDDNAVENE